MTTRDHIVEAADDLFYRQGYERTSFADIAETVGISRGNFYYHFKTKDQILDAVIAARVERTKALLKRWEEEGVTPEECIRCFIRILIANQAKILLYGCPVGTLTTELSKLGHPAQSGANSLFTLFRTWLCEQFEQLGHNETDAEAHAMQLLMQSQGVATLASAFRDETYINQEVERMCDWLKTLSPTPA